MIPTFHIESRLFFILNIPAIDNNISGSVYKGSRPFGSRVQDVVIKSLPISNDALQQVVVNVNIHAPNPVLNIAGQADKTQPDYAKLEEITTYVFQAIESENLFDKEYDMQIQSQSSPIPVPEQEEHFVNIRVSINLPNNSIS